MTHFKIKQNKIFVTIPKLIPQKPWSSNKIAAINIDPTILTLKTNMAIINNTIVWNDIMISLTVMWERINSNVFIPATAVLSKSPSFFSITNINAVKPIVNMKTIVIMMPGAMKFINCGSISPYIALLIIGVSNKLGLILNGNSPKIFFKNSW